MVGAKHCICEVHMNISCAKTNKQITNQMSSTMSKIYHSEEMVCDLRLKGRFSSGLEGASAIKWFGDLTGERPCELMNNNHNQMKINLVWQNSCSLKWLQNQNRKFE